jgi:hypothetical protein
VVIFGLLPPFFVFFNHSTLPPLLPKQGWFGHSHLAAWVGGATPHIYIFFEKYKKAPSINNLFKRAHDI